MRATKRKLAIFIVISVLLVSAWISFVVSSIEKGPEYLTILHTNDVHGRIESLAKRSALIKRIEGSNQCVLTMDAGDFAQGTLFFNKFSGVPDVQLMHQASYDVGTLGNHEFDKGLEVTKNIVKNVKYPIVSANIKFINDPELQEMVQPYVIKECRGFKVGIIGLLPENLKTLTSVEDVEVYDTIETTRDIAKKIDSEVDLTVVLSHIGVRKDMLIARSVPEVDVIVGGHSHTLLKQPQVYGKTLVVQAGQFGEHLGRLDIKLQNKEVKDYYYDLISMKETKEVDRLIENKVADLAKEIEVYRENVVGVVAFPISLEGSQIRSKLLPVGTLVNTAIKSKVPYVDVVLQNSGGIRPYKKLDAGVVTVADIMTLLPFDNTIVTLEIKGSDLRSVLEHSSKALPHNDYGGFLQSLGLEYTVDMASRPGNKVFDIKINGRPLKYARYYKVAISNYMYRGGDGYTQFAGAKNFVDTGIRVQDTVIDYIKQNSPVAVTVKDRINLL